MLWEMAADIPDSFLFIDPWMKVRGERLPWRFPIASFRAGFSIS